MTRIGNILPRGVRNTAAQFGQNVVGGLAQRFGIPANTAARFGAALGPAAAGIAVLRFALPILGTAIVSAGKALNYFSEVARKNIDRVSQYSPQLTAGRIFLDAGRLQRDIRLANAMGDLGNRRLQAENAAEEAWAPWNQFTDAIGNMWGTLKSQASGFVGRKLGDFVSKDAKQLEFLAHLAKLDGIERFAKTAVDFWTGRGNNNNIDPFRASEMGAWLRNEASGEAAQAQRRRAREPLGPVK
jgi:hypothetical protein